MNARALPTITAPITATSIVNTAVTAAKLKAYHWEPTHPALALTVWEDERTDIHSITSGQDGTSVDGLDRYSFACACGYDTGEQRTLFEATALMISHALHTCAVCHGEKPTRTFDGRMDVFPRCSDCAF